MLTAADFYSMNAHTSKSWPTELAEKFELIKCLGVGGLSSVFLVEDRANPGFQMALKILNPQNYDNDGLNRFRKEFEVLTSLQHKNLIEAYQLIEIGESKAYLMEYVEGKNLLEVLRSGKLSHANIDQIFSQVLSALSVLHKNGLAHRDIKLENVLVREDGFVKLSDLGLMKKSGGTAASEVGVLLGTSQYLPPEYVKHNIYDFRSDIYATGLMLFECLVGKRWLAGKKGAKAIRYLCDMNFEFPKLALAGLPHKYQLILKTALSVQPWKRFKDAESMRQALLSESGNGKMTESVEVAETISIQAVHQRRKTQEFISIQAKRQKWIFGGAGIIGIALLVAIIGIAAKETSKVAPVEIEKPVAVQQAPAADLETKETVLPNSKLQGKSANLSTVKVKKANVSAKSP